MPYIRDIKGEAVGVYCEPLITKEIGYYRLSRRANKNEINYQNPYFTDGRNVKLRRIIKTIIEIKLL